MAETKTTNAETKVTVSVGNSKEATAENKSKAVDTETLGLSVEETLEAKIQQATEEKYIEQQVAMRLAQVQSGIDAIDTDNPNNLKAGERPTYVVGGRTVSPNGQVVESSQDAMAKDDGMEDESLNLSPEEANKSDK